MKELLLITSLLLVGCASLANTPAQDRTWARLEACGRANPSMNLGTIQVRADGGWSSTGDLASVRALSMCMNGGMR